MEDIVITQYQLMESIEKVLTNFSKDGPDRRTSSSIQRRLATLQSLWNEFNGNHGQLTDYQDEKHDYFQKDCYNRTKDFYGKLVSYLSEYVLYVEKPDTTQRPVTPKFFKLTQQTSSQYPLGTPEPSSARSPMTQPETSRAGTSGFSSKKQAASPVAELQVPKNPTYQPKYKTTVQSEGRFASAGFSSTSGSPSKLEEMLRKQKSNFKAFSRTITNINFESLSEKWEFEDILKHIEARWTTIDQLHWEIDSELTEEDEEYERTFSAYENEYNIIKKEINQKRGSASYKTHSMPTMDIPTFHGDYHKWVSFKDLFIESIHSNRSISNAQKMQFLKSKVKGEAEKLIQHLNISSPNYELCWDILNHRYNNNKLIFNSHVNILMSLPVMQQQVASIVKRMHDTTKECLNAIKNLNVDISSWDPLLVYILSQKLDAETHKDYIESVNNPRELPSLQEFLDFLENKFTSLEASKRKHDIINQKYSTQSSSFSTKRLPAFQHQNQQIYHNNKQFLNNNHSNKSFTKSCYTSSTTKCPHCNGEHGIFSCKDFINISNEAKLKAIKQMQLCVNCLYDHNGKKCISTKTCRKCSAQHNTILHDAFSKPSKQPPNSHKENVNVSQNDQAEILLATAKVNVLAADGTSHSMRALIDQGSQISLITENAAQTLGLSRRQCKGVVFGLGAQENNSKGAMLITASSIYGDFTFNADVIIMKNLINNLPNKSFQKPSWKHIQNISLADPEFNVSRPVDLLLGADIYSLIMLGGIIKGENDSLPMAQQTHLGWLLCGKANTYHCNVVINNLDDIQRFWSIEDIEDNSINMSKEDYYCLQQYKEQTTRQSDGRYIVRLPMKPDTAEKLGQSKHRAIAQFYQLEKKLNKNYELSEGYKSFIHEYIDLGHMHRTSRDSNRTPVYLPHHCVLRADSTTTKLRVVFNASSPTSSGHSLNDLMYSGPNLQQDLLTLILKWRQYEVAFTADIEKMFRQILVHKEDQSLQRIIWRDDTKQTLQEYNLATVTYGTKAAPFLAMMTLKQLANDEGHKYSSQAKQALEEHFYMDDILFGAHSITSARQIQTDLIKLLQSGGFNLRKWSCNKRELLQGVETVPHQQAFDFKYPESTKTLGLQWNPQHDLFSFQIKLNPASTKTLSKRKLLSEISKVFDPLGWLSPVTTKLKLLFQRVWLHDVQWDTELPEEFSTEWQKTRVDLQKINNINVQRWLKTQENDEIELHGFCDSSIKAFACVIYCRVIKQQHSVDKQCAPIIIAAKTRLVPIKKKITLPRLELMSCLLLSKLMATVLKSLPNHRIKIFGWTDSMAALGWLQGDTNRWKPFVANRVEHIIAIMPSHHWRYVKSIENPADCASRGITASQLIEHPLWWSGPTWLASFNSENQSKHSNYITDLDLKKSVQTNVATTNRYNVISDIVNKHSNLTRATRVLAWVLRAVSSNRLKQAHLSVNEILKAKQRIIHHHQHLDFAEEIKSLTEKKKICTKSKILSLNPFIDQNGLLRVGGRIKNAYIQEDMKHPYIISHEGHLTNLLIDQAHMNTFHGGARLTLARLREHYWIIGGNRAIKKRLRTCVICRRHAPTKQNQLMGDLPAARINPTRPFFHTGVDFTGYVDVKSNKGRGIKTTKGYIAVFVCMATKAVHLELVSDLSSSAFLAALRRMAARRGAPRHVYCDNGTNFVGASRTLQQEYINLQATLDVTFFSQVSDMEIEFHFNAPSWPSAGGLWEAAVKSLKHHLRRVLGEQKLTYEEFSTLLSQLEACLNSRPLCTLSEDPNDTEYLTPAHFLASGPTLTVIETERDERTRWQLTQKIFSDIWKRWQAEYLCQLTARSKWQQPQQNQKVGDIVIIHDANLPAGKWSLGRIVELHPGKDGHVRVVSVKTKNNIIQRPIVKLSTLPVNNDASLATAKQPIQQEKSISNTAKRTRTLNAPISYLATMTITLLTIMFMFMSPVHCAYNITQLKNNQSIYFDKITNMHLIRDEWKLIVYYDMSPYWEGNEILTKYIDSLEGVCYKDKKPSLCDVILLQLRHGFAELEHYNKILLGQQTTLQTPRVRRGLINGIGNIAHSLFGVLDDQFAEQYSKDIELIRAHQNHLTSLWKNQTSLIEAEHNLLQRMEETINKQHKTINHHIISLEKLAISTKQDIQTLLNSNEFALSSIIANNILRNLKNIQGSLLDTVMDLYYRSFNIHLITPEQLQNELNIISSQISQDLTLPINNLQSELPKLYHLLKVKAKMTKEFFIFEIKIPLVARDYYEIFKLIPIPQKHQNNMVSIIPISEWIAINMQKDSYFTMTQYDIHECQQYDDITYLCPLQRPVYHMTSDKSLCVTDDVSKQCVIDTMPCKTTWSPLRQENTQLFSCCGAYTIRIICGDQVSAERLNQSGIITLGQGCIIKSDVFTIYSHRQQNNVAKVKADVLTIEVPPINHIIDLPLPAIEEMSTALQNNLTNLTSYHIQLKEMGEQIQQMKNQADVVLPDSTSAHDYTQNILLYIIIGAILCMGAAYTWRRLRTCHPGPAPAAGTVAAPPIPLADVAPPPSRAHPSAREPPTARRAPTTQYHQRASRVLTTADPGVPYDDSSDDAERRYARIISQSSSRVARNHYSE